MKHYREINNPIEVMHHITCDRCKSANSTYNGNWDNYYKKEDFITIKRQTRDEGYHTEEIDCCPDCWINVVRPALEYAGFTFQENEQ